MDADVDISIEIITEVFRRAQAVIQDMTLPTRVLDDVFHFMDRLLRLLSKKHSAFKAFSHDFSEAIFICNKDDEAAVKAVLEKRGINWEYAKRSKAPGLHRRIQRYIPDCHTLAKRLDILFTGYQDILCLTCTQHSGCIHFFTNEAKEMVERLCNTATKGFLSDPIGVPLYYIMCKDHDGLTLYRTVRGTNSVEGGVHMAV